MQLLGLGEKILNLRYYVNTIYFAVVITTFLFTGISGGSGRAPSHSREVQQRGVYRRARERPSPDREGEDGTRDVQLRSGSDFEY